LFGKDLNRKEFLPYTILDGKLDERETKCTQEHISELWNLLYKIRKNIPSDVYEDYVGAINITQTLYEYRRLKQELVDRDITPLQRLRNGENLSAKDMNVAAHQVTDEENS
jgi:hypothetical protein